MFGMKIAGNLIFNADSGTVKDNTNGFEFTVEKLSDYFISCVWQVETAEVSFD